MTWHIAWREMRNLFLSPLAWCTLAVAQFLLAFVFLGQLEYFVTTIQPRLLAIEGAPGVTDLVAMPVLNSATMVLLLIVPLLSMRSIAEERRTGTLRLLMSAPVSTHEIVLGKYLGLTGLLLVMIAMILLMPVSLTIGTSLDWGKLAAGALGLVLLVGAFAAAGVFMSTLTAQPVVAAISTFGLLLLLLILDWAGSVEVRFSELFSYLSLQRHMQALQTGTFNSADVIYFLLFIVAFLGVAVRRLDAGRLQR
jgi:ABC-2 type transport system permease protein